MDTSAADPLERIRDELVAAAGRTKRRRTRRRRIYAGTALLGVFVVTTAGAAVGDFETGVGVVDRLLNTEGGGQEATDRQPGPGTASEPLRLPDASDGRGATALAYLSRDGRICLAEADLRRSDGAPRGTSGGPCYGPDGLAQELREKTAIVVGGSVGSRGQVSEGFAANDVVALRFYADSGTRFNAQLTPAWTPNTPGAEPLRLFVAVDDSDSRAEGEQLQFKRYRIEAELSNGKTVDVRSP